MPRLSSLKGVAARYSQERLACLLHSVGEVTRSGRTLFLFDENNRGGGERLAELIALLTLGFPKGLRRDLTFSTFHDRPSALPGYRIQGTTGLGRADLPSMQALGVVEDLAAEPRTRALPRWAITLSGWMIQGDDNAWTSTCEDLFPRIHACLPPSQAWQDGSLDALFSFVEWNGLPPEQMMDRSTRENLASLVAWAGKAGLGRVWSDQHGPDWWSAALRASGASGTACSILLTQAKWSDPATGVGPAPSTIEREARQWAEVVAQGFANRQESDWQKAVRAFLTSLPSGALVPFLSSLMSSAPSRAESTLAWLQEAAVVPASLVLPLWAVLQLGPPPALDRLRKVLLRSMARPELTAPVLQTLRSELQVRDQPADSLSTALADALFAARASRTPQAWRSLWTGIVSWAVRGPEPEGWLSAVLRRTFSPPFDPEDWCSLIQGLPDRDRSALIPLALSTTLVLPGDGQAFLWCIEALWLSLTPEQRDESLAGQPDESDPDRTWVNAYVERLPADLDQFARLFPPSGAESALSL
ncbi:MAG TPA: hypothetical protein VFT74_13880, partial [Isosphaeraceae bacterium]|nr:hypothetical protein [Isosphaeraceae bacterium]